MNDHPQRILSCSLLTALLLLAGCGTGLIAGEPPCNGHGGEEEGLCVCDAGYTGADCASCAPGYQDNDDNTLCELDCANSGLNCTGPQHCDDASGTARCECEDGFALPDCTECDVGYQDNDGDLDCEPSCSHPELACSDHGACDDSSGAVVCDCDDGYAGAHCGQCATGLQDNDQDGDCTTSCSGASGCQSGTCDDSSGTVSCTCEPEYTGPTCEACADGYQDNDGDGTCLETCQTAGYTCSDHGTCVDTSGEAACDCEEGYHDDGQGHCVSASFIVTLVNDGLDPTDGTLMRQGLGGLGYVEETYDSNVSSSELVSYLETPVTLVYHTGHGLEGAVMTSDGQIDTDSATIEATHTIFATCLTLTYSWAGAFSPSAMNVMGYTEVSFDGPDDDVVQEYVAELGGGRTHLQAWYLANTAVSALSDRWATNSRVGGEIVEYSARSGDVPPLGSSARVALDPRLAVAAELLGEGGADATAAVRAMAADPALVAAPAAPWSEVAAGELTDWLAATSRTADQATALAEAHLAARGWLPADAVLDRVVAIEARPAGTCGPGAVVGHAVRWRREVAGRPVRGMAIADHVTVLVGGAGVVAVSSYWPALSVGAGPAADQVLDAGRAIERAAPAIARRVKRDTRLEVVAVEPVWVTRGPSHIHRALIPGYQLVCADGTRLVVDAERGELLR